MSAKRTAWRLTASRSPSKWQVAVWGVSPFLAQPKHTVPTGLDGEPPVGPATPEMDTARSASERSSVPRAIAAHYRHLRKLGREEPQMAEEKVSPLVVEAER